MLQMNSKNKFFHQNNYNKLYGLFIIFLWLLLSYFVLFVTRIDPNQEMAQKIFYFHVPSAWIAGVSYLVVMISGVNYLRTKNNYFVLCKSLHNIWNEYLLFVFPDCFQSQLTNTSISGWNKCARPPDHRDIMTHFEL